VEAVSFKQPVTNRAMKERVVIIIFFIIYNIRYTYFKAARKS
jgi:hypothetical protein